MAAKPPGKVRPNRPWAPDARALDIVGDNPLGPEPRLTRPRERRCGPARPAREGGREAERRGHRGREQQQRGAREEDRDLALLGLGAELRAEPLVDVAELVGVLGLEGLATRQRRDPPQRLGIGRDAYRAAVVEDDPSGVPSATVKIGTRRRRAAVATS